MGSEGLEDVRRHTVTITKWIAESMEQILRDRAGWRTSVRCVTPATDHHS